MSRGDDIWRPVFWTDPLNWLNWLIEWLYTKPRRLLHWWRFRHNPAPAEDFEQVRDREGRTYWLREGGDRITVWRLCHRGEEVGRMNALWLEGEAGMEIGDIEIEPKHRGRNLGALLLARAEAHARGRGATMITGRLVAKDVQAFPGLPAWYRARGYDILPAASGHGGTETVAHIRKAIG